MTDPAAHCEISRNAITLVSISEAAARELAIKAAWLHHTHALSIELPVAMIGKGGLEVARIAGDLQKLLAATESQDRGRSGRCQTLLRMVRNRGALEAHGCHASFEESVVLTSGGDVLLGRGEGQAFVARASLLQEAGRCEHFSVRDFIRRTDPVPTLSTAHLTAGQIEKLAAGQSIEGTLTIFTNECGWMLYRDEIGCGPTLPKNLEQMFKWASAMGTPYLRFDCDGAELECFEHFVHRDPE